MTTRSMSEAAALPLSLTAILGTENIPMQGAGPRTGTPAQLLAYVQAQMGFKGVTASTITFAVPGTYTTIQAALDATLQYIAVGSALLDIVVTNGTHVISSMLTCRHPQPDRVRIRAATTPAAIAESAFTGVKATDEAMVRAHHGVVLEFANVHAFDAALFSGCIVEGIALILTSGSRYVWQGPHSSRIRFHRCNVVGFISWAYHTGPAELTLSDSSISHGTSSSRFENGGAMIASGSTWRYCGSAPILAQFGARLDMQSCTVKDSATAVSVYSMSRARLKSCTLGATGSAVFAAYGGGEAYVETCTLTGGTLPFYALQGSKIVAIGTTYNGGQVFANVASFIADTTPGGTLPTYSPAKGIIGNNNSIIV